MPVNVSSSKSPRVNWIVKGDVRIGCGDSSTHHTVRADFVFTHPYVALPPALHGTPAVFNTISTATYLSKLVGRTVEPIGKWGVRNILFKSGVDLPPIDLSDLREDDGGWFPLELPLRVLQAAGLPRGSVVWDGFMGRGTIGKACQMLGLGYIGIDVRPERVRMALEYLGLEGKV